MSSKLLSLPKFILFAIVLNLAVIFNGCGFFENAEKYYKEYIYWKAEAERYKQAAESIEKQYAALKIEYEKVKGELEKHKNGFKKMYD
jgi:hypothetical protein